MPVGIDARTVVACAATPYLTVQDAAASLSFYEQAFGFTPEQTISTPGGRVIHAAMHYDGALAIRFSPEGVWSGVMKSPATTGTAMPITLCVACPDVGALDALAERARAAGATIVTEPCDVFWGERITRIADPDGYLWCFAVKVSEVDPAMMPAVEEVEAGLDLDLGF